MRGHSAPKFQLTRPLRGVTLRSADTNDYIRISTHTPLAGRDAMPGNVFERKRISTHTPLAGRDVADAVAVVDAVADFNSHAPCGA